MSILARFVLAAALAAVLALAPLSVGRPLDLSLGVDVTESNLSLEEEKAELAELVDALSPGDALQVFTFDRYPRTVFDCVVTDGADRQAARRVLAALRSTPERGTAPRRAHNHAAAWLQQRAAERPGADRMEFLGSDHQEDLGAEEPLAPLPPGTRVVSAWLDTSQALPFAEELRRTVPDYTAHNSASSARALRQLSETLRARQARSQALATMQAGAGALSLLLLGIGVTAARRRPGFVLAVDGAAGPAFAAPWPSSRRFPLEEEPGEFFVRNGRLHFRNRTADGQFRFEGRTYRGRGPLRLPDSGTLECGGRAVTFELTRSH